MLARNAASQRGVKKPASDGGWLLVAFIVVLTFVFLVLAGVILFLTEHRKTLALHHTRARAVYLAEAGIMRALHDFRDGNWVSLGEVTVEAGAAPGAADDEVFILGGEAADFLLVNLYPTTFDDRDRCGKSTRMWQWRIWNVLADTAAAIPVAMEQMVVEWEPNSGELVNRVRLDGGAPEFNSCGQAKASGEIIDLDTAPLPIDPEEQWNNNEIYFTDPNQDMETKNWIRLTFVLSDGSQRQATWQDPPSTSPTIANFTIKSVGEARRAPLPFVAWRRLQAEYRLSHATDLTRPGSILDYRELKAKSP